MTKAHRIAAGQRAFARQEEARPPSTDRLDEIELTLDLIDNTLFVLDTMPAVQTGTRQGKI